jgi:hypothetical protein
VAPSAFDVHPLQAIAVPERAQGEIHRELRRIGFTHVLVNRPEWERLGNSYYRNLWPKEGRMAVDRFLADHVAMYADGIVSIYDLERGTGKPR